ncbi:MAG: hypothetical protein ACLQHK_04500 [Gallionellaceae bacterium]
MSSLNLEQFSTRLPQLNFNSLFTDVLGWNHPPVSERTGRADEAKDKDFRILNAVRTDSANDYRGLMAADKMKSLLTRGMG